MHWSRAGRRCGSYAQLNDRSPWEISSSEFDFTWLLEEEEEEGSNEIN